MLRQSLRYVCEVNMVIRLTCKLLLIFDKSFRCVQEPDKCDEDEQDGRLDDDEEDDGLDDDEDIVFLDGSSNNCGMYLPGVTKVMSLSNLPHSCLIDSIHSVCLVTLKADCKQI